MHRFLQEDRIELEGGTVVRIVNARSAGSKFHEDVDIYKETEDGREYVRNLCLCAMGGYLADFPDDTFPDGSRRGVDEWSEPNIKIGGAVFDTHSHLDSFERELILSKHPDFKYVLAKWDGSKSQVMKVLKIWRRHKEIEFPLSLGYYRIAVNENFYKSRKKDVARYLMKNKPRKNIALCDIQMMLRRGIDGGEVERYKEFCRNAAGKFPYDEYRYLKKIGMADFRGSQFYREYKAALERAGHSLKDPYWRFPKDLRATHGRVLEEARRREEAERLAEAEWRRMETAEKMRLYGEKAKGFAALNSVIGGYSVYVPETAEDWLSQADALHQCIVTSDYIGKVAKGKCLIVFVRKEGKPVATAEVLKDGTLGQFYADELDRRDCLPSEDVRKAMDEWLARFRRKTSAGLLAA